MWVKKRRAPFPRETVQAGGQRTRKERDGSLRGWLIFRNAASLMVQETCLPLIVKSSVWLSLLLIPYPIAFSALYDVLLYANLVCFFFLYNIDKLVMRTTTKYKTEGLDIQRDEEEQEGMNDVLFQSSSASKSG